MPDLPEASSTRTAQRCLVIAENIEAAYRYAASDSRETDIVLASADGTFEGAEGSYGQVIVAGFAAAPEVLGTLVASAFGHADTVSLGASGQPTEGSAEAWQAAFGPFRVANVTHGAFPAVQLVQEPCTATGDFVRGALSVLAHWVPRPDLRPVLTTDTTSDSSVPPKAPVPAASMADRALRLLKNFVKSHRKLAVVGAVGTVLAIAVTVGLVALIDQYAVGVLVLAVLLLLALSTLLQELRGRRLQAAVARIDSRSASLRDLAPPFQPATVAERLNNHSTGLNSLQRSLSVVELASVDAAKSLERLEAALDADRGGRA